ncbi:MAG: glycogen/starch synthase [Candidatus Omnitrophota bacterium]
MDKTLHHLEFILRRANIPEKIKNPLLETLADFKSGKDGRRIGVTQSIYENPGRYYYGFGTQRAIGLGEEFLDSDNPLAAHSIEAAFHELYTAMRSSLDPRSNDIEGNILTHLEALRLQAFVFWGLTEQELNWMSLKELEDHPLNKLGAAIRECNAERRAMVSDDWQYLLGRLHEVLSQKSQSKLGNFLAECNDTLLSRPRYPVEGCYPILRAVNLLSKEEQSKLLTTLNLTKNRHLRDLQVVDSIMLMLEKDIPDDWAMRQVPHLKGRRVWQISSEIWNPAGGLGRVMQFHGLSMHELLKAQGIPLIHVEPYYYHGKNRDTGKFDVVQDYDKILGAYEGKDENKLQEVDRFAVPVGAQKALAICYRGVNRFGIETYLIKGFGQWQKEGEIPYYTEGLYHYKERERPDLCTMEEYSAFFSAASAMLEERVEGRIKAQDKDWRAPVTHWNDGQLGLAPYFVKEGYMGENFPLIKEGLVAFTTHTYYNRVYFDDDSYGRTSPENVMTYLGIPNEHWKYFRHHREGFVPVFDFSSAGIRTANWVGGVAAKHVDDLYLFHYDHGPHWNGPDIIAVTNGDVRAITAGPFRAIMKEAAGADVDVEAPTNDQVMVSKRLAKEKANQRFGWGKVAGAKVKLDPNLPVVSYTGRGVEEKAGRQRALSPDNIRELVKMGVQVVIGLNVAREPAVEETYAYLYDELQRRQGEFSGRFIFQCDMNVEDQRAVLAASDMQIQDSDPNTEAAGNSEADILACAGIEVAPPWPRGEGNLVNQGIRFNPDVLGEGGVIIPDIQIPEDQLFKLRKGSYDPELNKLVAAAYLKALKTALVDKPKELGMDPIVYLSHYQANSVPSSRILDARLTGAVYLRQWDSAVANKESAPVNEMPAKGSIASGLQAFYDNFKDRPVTYQEFKDSRIKYPGTGATYSETTVRKELDMLEKIGLITVDRSEKAYKYILSSDIRNLSPPVIAEIYSIDELSRYEMSWDEIGTVRIKIDQILGPLATVGKGELNVAVDYMKQLLPDGDSISREDILANLVASNVNDGRRFSYEREGKKHTLPATFIFKGSVFSSYKGKEKPRFIVLTVSPNGVAITSVFSKTKNENYVLSKGGCRWYRVGESGIESMEEKFKGNPAKNLDPLLNEGVRLAEAMYYKNPFWEVYFDGGKTIFLGTREASKEEFVKDWVASSILAGSLMKLYIAGPDTEMGYDEMAWIEEEKTDALRQFGMKDTGLLATTSRDPKVYGTFPHEEWTATSIGVVETMLTALSSDYIRATYNLNTIESGKLTLAIMGLGDVGGGNIWYLAKSHPEIFAKLNIQLVGNGTGSIYCKEGLDKAKLLDIVERIREKKLDRNFDVQEMFKEEIKSGKYTYIKNPRDAYFCGADILIPSARGTFILSEDDVKRMHEAGTKLYNEGANNSVASGLEALFAKYGIGLFDGPIANGGGIYFSKEEIIYSITRGEKEIFDRSSDWRYMVAGDVADTAIANADWLIQQVISGKHTSTFEANRFATAAIMEEKARLLDSPTPAEKAEIERRVEIIFARGIDRNEDNRRIFTIIYATEFAREKVMGSSLGKDVILAGLSSDNPRTLRTSVYWAGKLRMKEAAPRLVEIARDTSAADTLRRLAAVSIGYINGPDHLEDMKALKESANLPREVELGADWAIEHIVAGTESPEPSKAQTQGAFMKEVSEAQIGRAEVFKNNLIRLLTENPDQVVDLGIDTDIGEAQKTQMMPIYTAIDQIEKLTDANGNKLFKNLRITRAKGMVLASKLIELDADLSFTFVVAKEANLVANKFDSIAGKAWITAIDDSTAGPFSYLPVFEAATISMMAALKADEKEIIRLYNAIADAPIPPAALQDMLSQRIIRVLPKTVQFDPNELRKLYELVEQVYASA